MTTFKHGCRVTCEINGTKITDARISIDEDGTPYICQDIKSGNPVDDKLGYKYSWELDKDFTRYSVTNLKLAGPKQLEDIEVGDVLLESGKEYPVLMRSGVVSIHEYEDARGIKCASAPMTIDELKHKGYTIKQEEPVKMTVAQVAEKLGHEVEIVK